MRRRWQTAFWVAGRLPRRPYWIGLLALLVVSLGARLASQQLGPQVGGPLYAVVEAAVAWVAICLFARRLHDVGRSGWWQAPALGLSVAGFALARPSSAAGLHLGPTGQALSVMVGMAAYFGFIIALGMVRGAETDNRFGPAAPPTPRKPLI